MKYLKTYEHIKKLQLNDYVVCKEEYYGENLKKFISENIGQYVGKGSRNNYIIRYENIPEYLNLYFAHHYIIFTFCRLYVNSCRDFFIEEIIYWSPNKEDCELFLASKKYNI